MVAAARWAVASEAASKEAHLDVEEGWQVDRVLRGVVLVRAKEKMLNRLFRHLLARRAAQRVHQRLELSETERARPARAVLCEDLRGARDLVVGDLGERGVGFVNAEGGGAVEVERGRDGTLELLQLLVAREQHLARV